MKLAVILLAAGSGSRFGGLKQTKLLKGIPVYMWSLKTVTGLSPDFVVLVEPADAELKVPPAVFKVKGGRERAHSVYRALQFVQKLSPDFVLIHDSARPFATCSLFKKVIKALSPQFGVVPGIRVRDTLKKVKEGVVEKTLNRENVWQIQTPQGFPFKGILEAYKKFLNQEKFFSDDASYWEAAGGRVRLVEGEVFNIKITYPEDWDVAECIASCWDRHGFSCS